MRTHRIVTDKLVEFWASSKLNAERAFLTTLKEEGPRCTEALLAEHGDDLGRRSTADIGVLLAEVAAVIMLGSDSGSGAFSARRRRRTRKATVLAMAR